MKLTKIISAFCLVALSFGLMMAAPVEQKLAANNFEQAKKPTLAFAAFLVDQDLNIEFTEDAPSLFTVELYSVTGKKMDSWEVEKPSQKSYQLSLEKPLPKSIYIVKIIAQQQVVAKKVQF